MASSKLEMLKNIRAQRAAEELKKTEAVERARLAFAYVPQASSVQTFMDISLKHSHASSFSCILSANENSRLLILWITQCLHI